MNTKHDDTAPFSDSEIAAYADGELDVARRTALTRALDRDGDLAQRVNVLREQRTRLAAAWPADDEPLPPALQQAAAALAARLAASQETGAPPVAAPQVAAPVADLAAARTARAAQAAAWPGLAPAERARRAWQPGWGIAASLALAAVLGVVVGRSTAPTGAELAFSAPAGAVVAQGRLAQALGSALASSPEAGSLVAVQLSFADAGGNYCRTFSMAAVSGLACKQGGQWRVQALAAAEAGDVSVAGGLRQAASAVPPAILSAVDQRAAGPVLDAAAERAARDRGWER
ncbi:MAG: hypothetical protein Q7U99_17470 [Rubrivivax sp.]|nr:hypothetical protein [Rubrivivax sp.]